MKPRTKKILFIGVVLFGIHFAWNHRWHLRPSAENQEVLSSDPKLTKASIARSLGAVQFYRGFPSEIELLDSGAASSSPRSTPARRVILQYALDGGLQAKMETLLAQTRPDYAAFVALDATTGRILSLVSSSTRDTIQENLALKATFPAASIFKVVTAAAAIGEKNFTADTEISFQGRNHTLYKSAILKPARPNRWTRQVTLREAFGQSINTVFGKIGAFSVGAEDLQNYADRFQFNRPIQADVLVEQGRAPITDDPWLLAESASGFTQENTMSPLQGALIAASIVNDGKMMEPYLVQSIHSLDGSTLYTAAPKMITRSVDQRTAHQIRSLMRETVERGTSKKSFRRFFRGKMEEIEVGGKTGSLTGTNPPGKVDWFVGYAEAGNQRIAICALTINEKNWRVKSSYMARVAIEQWFRGER